MKENKTVWTKWLYWFSFGVAIIIVYKTLDSFSEISNWIKGLMEVMMPFLIGILLAYLFYLPVRKVEKWYRKSKIRFISKKARAFSVFTVYTIFLLLVIISINFVIPNITKSIMDLTNNLPNYYHETIERLSNLPEDSVFYQIDLKKWVEDISEIDIGAFLNLERIGEYAKGVINFASSIFSFFVSIIVSIYILLERTQIICFFRDLAKVVLKKENYRNLVKYFNRTNSIFFKFLSSQLLDAIVVGILTSLAMWLLGVKYAVLLGVMIGIFNLIPYFGAIIAVTLAILITLLTGGLAQAVWMAIVVIVLQQIDANIINPKIVGNSLKISPLLVIFAVTIGGAYFGVLGMFLAVPVITVMKLMLIDYIKYKKGILQSKSLE